MPDPANLTGVGLLALTEGIKFLYGQAGELLKALRDRHNFTERLQQTTEVLLPTAAFEGNSSLVAIDYGRLADLHQAIRQLRAQVADYAEGIDQIDPSDLELLKTIDALRGSLEAVYGQHIVFRGESRTSIGVPIVAAVRVNEVLGYVAGVRAREVHSNVSARVDAGRVEPEGTVIGLDVDSIG